MEVGDWITLAAVIVALGLGVASILHTRSIQKSERRERLLNKTIEWAINIINWRSESKGIFREIVNKTNPKDVQLLKHAHIIEVKESFVGMHGRNQHIYNITFKLGLSLHEAVEKLIKRLKTYVNQLNNWQQTVAGDISKADDMTYANKVDKSERQVVKLAVKVIEEATKLETRNID